MSILKKLSFKKDKTPKVEITTDSKSVSKLLDVACAVAQVHGMSLDIPTLLQERSGQTDLLHSSQMPVKLNRHSYFKGAAADAYALLGFSFVAGKKGELPLHTTGDDLFMDIIFPTGWTRDGNGHALHSYVLDDKGRKRIHVFYKAASHDRRALIDIECRYKSGVETVLPEGERRSDWYYKNQNHLPQYGYIKDADTIIWKTEVLTPIVGAKYGMTGCYLTHFTDLDIQAKLKLTELYPAWIDPFAYWD